MGKGSKQRPTDMDKYSVNWERIFGMKEKEQKQEKKLSQKTEENKKNK